MPKKKEYVSNHPKETFKIAEEILRQVLKTKKNKSMATVVGLSGDLGAGKTTLVKALAQHLGIKARLSSPTFVIMKKYPLKGSKDHEFLFHLDAYRLKNERELELLGWKEIIKDPKNLIFIEWPENVPGSMPPSSRFVHISHQGENKRGLKVV